MPRSKPRSTTLAPFPCLDGGFTQFDRGAPMRAMPRYMPNLTDVQQKRPLTSSPTLLAQPLAGSFNTRAPKGRKRARAVTKPASPDAPEASAKRRRQPKVVVDLEAFARRTRSASRREEAAGRAARASSSPLLKGSSGSPSQIADRSSARDEGVRVRRASRQVTELDDEITPAGKGRRGRRPQRPAPVSSDEDFM